MEDELPSISIVVPNFNNARTLQRCLDSVLDQAYQNLELIVVDGGSTDGSLSTIEHYAPHLKWWVSETDRGQSHALNKGLAVANGSVVNWLCSDDYFLPGALHAVGNAFVRDPGACVVVGVGELRRPADGHVYQMRPNAKAIELMPCQNPIFQPACFWRRTMLAREQPIDETFMYAMDFELWNYLSYVAKARFVCIPEVLAVFEVSGDNKTSTGGERIIDEVERVYVRYCGERVPLTYWHRRLRLPLERVRKSAGIPARICVRPLQIMLTLILGAFYGFDRVRAMNWSAFL